MAKHSFSLWRYLKHLFFRIMVCCICLMLLSILLVGSLHWFNPPLSSFMLGYSVSSDKRVALQYEWQDWEIISKEMALAVIAAEDQRFADHHGLDFKQLHLAWVDYQKGKSIRGASTITQQLAKNLFLWSDKSFFRKGLELWFTLWMEVFLSKQRILEIYLNIVEFGVGVYGIEAASQVYFNKSASGITRTEAALLTAVLPNPKSYKLINPSGFMLKRQRWILGQMKQLGSNMIEKIEHGQSLWDKF